MQKWEYCLVTGIQFHEFEGVHGKDPYFIRFTKQGQDMQKISGSPNEQGKVIAELIFNLGFHGWEMVSNENNNIFFKRPLAE